MMKQQFISILICLSFSEALALTCYDCYNDCPNPNQTTPCSDKCATTSGVRYRNGVVLRNRDRTCFEEACYNISFNAGVVKIAFNKICCDSDLCNNEPFPDVDMRPNGKQCHFCAGENCLGIVYCEGIENLCFTYIDATDGTELNVKGCASESACIVPTKGLDFTGMNTDRNISIKCCEGNLCNSAKSVTLSFILMLPLLLSTLLFH